MQEFAKNMNSWQIGDNLFSGSMQELTGKFRTVSGPQYLRAARSYARAAASSVS